MTTLIEEFSALADELRQLHNDFGTRPYRVMLVAIRRKDRMDADAGDVEVVSETTMDPTPRITGNHGLALSEWNSLPDGAIVADEVSLSYTVADLMGEAYQDDPEVEFFWELRQIVPADENAERRRYRPMSVPETVPKRVGWRVQLVPMVSDRSPDGTFREPYDE